MSTASPAGNRRLLTTLLRDRLGFRGVVVSDWAALLNYPFMGWLKMEKKPRSWV